MRLAASALTLAFALTAAAHEPTQPPRKTPNPFRDGSGKGVAEPDTPDAGKKPEPAKAASARSQCCPPTAWSAE